MKGSPAKILVADDDRDVAQAIAKVLQEEGRTILIANDGAEAVEIATRERPDLLILDLLMPKLNGFQVTRTLREQAETSGATIIVLTGLQSQEAAAESFASGVDDFLTKPVIPGHLRARVQTWLLRRAEARSRQED